MAEVNYNELLDTVVSYCGKKKVGNEKIKPMRQEDVAGVEYAVSIVEPIREFYKIACIDQSKVGLRTYSKLIRILNDKIHNGSEEFEDKIAGMRYFIVVLKQNRKYMASSAQ